MTQKQIDLLKKFFCGIIIFSLLLFLSQALISIPKWTANKHRQNGAELLEKYNQVQAEVFEFENEVNRLEFELSEIESGNDFNEEDYSSHTHWTDLKYVANNQETIDLLKNEVEQLRKEKDLVSVLTLEETVNYIHQHTNKVKGNEPTIFGKNEAFSIELRDKNKPQLIRNNKPPVYQTNLFITGPWAVVLHESEAGISRYFDIVYTDPRLNAHSRENIDLGKAFELMEGVAEDDE